MAIVVIRCRVECDRCPSEGPVVAGDAYDAWVAAITAGFRRIDRRELDALIVCPACARRDVVGTRDGDGRAGDARGT